MGSRPLSIKGQQAWGGITRLNTNDRGQRRFVKLENAYVSQDGQEIRQFPGYATLVDLTEVNNSSGYSRYSPDAVRPVLEFGGASSPYNLNQAYGAGTSQTLWSRAKMSSLFGFEQIGNELFILGESRYREDPIYDTTGTQLTVTNISNAGAGTTYGFTLSNTVSANTQFDSGGVGLNGLKIGDVIMVGTITTADSGDQTMFASDLVGVQHEVTNVVGAQVTVSTTSSGTISAPSPVATCEIHRIRPNRDNDYPAGVSTPALGPYTDDYDKRPDDPDALTVWRVSSDLKLADTTFQNEYPCYPAWVANRQRDFGDNNDTFSVEGILLEGDPGSPVRGASRREQRRLPYRPCIEPALNRIILAAPGYGCMFQIPAIVPIDPSDWQSPTESNVGIPTAWNSVYDKPRSLGVPKARLVESQNTPAPFTPGNIGSASVPFDASLAVYTGSPDTGLAAGTYRLAIAWEDVGTGEEGLASEAIYVDIPTHSTTEDIAHTIRINYVHPGYHMGETMALRMHVYLSAAGSEALAFYGSFELEDITVTDATDLSAQYGLSIATPMDPFATIRSFDLPIIGDDTTGSIDDVLDPTRLAPQSTSMPRGAEACKYIRGVLFSGGALGNAGRNGQLWRGKASSSYSAVSDFWEEDEFNIVSHSGTDAAVPSSGALDGDSQDGTLGIAGRAFPDAYQGIEFIEEDLLPGSSAMGQIDKVMNRKVPSLYRLEIPAANQIYQHHERLKLTRPYFNRVRQAGQPTGNESIDAAGKDIYYVMPRGQLQIGDPGRPEVASKAFVKVVDPRRGDDIKAIGQLGGSTIVCTQKETYSYSWYRNPAGEEPNLMSDEFGCIGNNTMVEFDGGLAWLSDRGPVALGQGLQHVGRDVAEDFFGDDLRYRRDLTGMMRHSWGVHDAQRGLVMWGLLTTTATHQIEWEGGQISASTATDEQLSRFPCDEVLIWSYRANAWSTWRPPAGLEVYWMRPLRDADGYTRMCFLAADGRIYALDDEWSDANGIFGLTLSYQADGAGTSSTTLVFGEGSPTFKDGDTAYVLKKNLALYLRAGMLVEFLDDYGNVVGETTISSVTSSAQSGSSTVELSAAQTWTKGQTIRIGGRQRATITSTYVGAETMDTMQVQRVQMRYALQGEGHANARVKMFRSEQGTGTGSEAFSVTFTGKDQWDALGKQKADTSVPSEISRLGRRISFSQGQISGNELAVQVELTGQAQVRIQDIILEVG